MRVHAVEPEDDHASGGGRPGPRRAAPRRKRGRRAPRGRLSCEAQFAVCGIQPRRHYNPRRDGADRRPRHAARAHPRPAHPRALLARVHPLRRALRPVHDRLGPPARPRARPRRPRSRAGPRRPGLVAEREASRRGPRSPSSGSSASSPRPRYSRDARRRLRETRSIARAGRCRRATRTARRRGARHRSRARCRPSPSSARWSSTCPAFLRGEKTGEEILFSPARLPLWFDYFSNDNLLYQINNRLGAEAVARALPADAAGDDRRDRRRLGLGRARRRRAAGARRPAARASSATSSPRSCRRSCAAPSGRSAPASRSFRPSSRASTWTRDFAEQGIAPDVRRRRVRGQHRAHRPRPRSDARAASARP